MSWELLVDGVDFGEGPSRHDGRLWYSDRDQCAGLGAGAIHAMKVDHPHAGRP